MDNQQSLDELKATHNGRIAEWQRHSAEVVASVQRCRKSYRLGSIRPWHPMLHSPRSTSSANCSASSAAAVRNRCPSGLGGTQH